MPGLELPAPSMERLLHSPLELVVCQVRHERNLAVSDAKIYLQVKDKLGDTYPFADPVSTTSLNISGNTSGDFSSTAQNETGWKLTSPDNFYTITIMPEFFTLETRAYSTWEDFSARLSEIVKIANDVYQPGMEVRLGLRFIDRIIKPQVYSPQEWKGWISDSLLGPVLDENLGPAIQNIQQVIQFDGNNNQQVILRHGIIRPENSPRASWQYLLDYDCFRAMGLPFSADSVCAGADQLHLLALSIFQASITPELFELLKE